MMSRKHRNKPFGRYGRFAAGILIAGFVFIIFNPSAWAHKVSIFAWVEKDRIHTQSKVSGGKSVKNAVVLVYDGNNRKLLQGKTDHDGKFSFKIPKTADLLVVLNASMGHRAQWKISAQELKAAGRTKIDDDSDDQTGRNQGPAPSKERRDRASVYPVRAGLSHEDMERLVNQSLDVKLAPIKEMLINLQADQPEISDIIGGIGYIIGLTGTALYITNRRKK